MKKVIYILVFVVTAISCDINRFPYDAMEDSAVFTDEANLASATLGNYSYLKGDGADDRYSWFNNWHRLCEYPSDNVSLSGTTNDPLFYTYTYNHIATGYRSNAVWSMGYKAIVGCNKIIDNTIEGTSDEMDHLIGENYYLRGMLHFQLVSIFGRPYNQGVDNMGVPIKIDSDSENLPARDSVGDVYAQVISDLMKGADLMSEVQKSNIFASDEAAYALLSRVYLYMEDNEKAIEYANKIIGDGASTDFSLLSTENLSKYPTFAPEDNSETIFALKLVKDKDYVNGWGSIGSMYANFQGSGWGELYASKPYRDLVGEYPEDVRNKFIEPQYVLDENGDNTYWSIYISDSYTFKTNEVTIEDGEYYYYVVADDGTESKHKVGVEVIDNEPVYTVVIDSEEHVVDIEYAMLTRNGYPKYYITKCSGQEEQAQLWSPVISRVAELYLIRAEANAKLGNSSEAIDDVNIIRERAGLSGEALYTTASISDEVTAFDLVMKERQLELAYEGHRKFDVFRNGLTMDRKYPGTHLNGSTPIDEIPATHNRVVEYIPESEILAQENLVQNP